MSKPNKEIWVERILTGLSAAVGLIAVIASVYGGLAMIWLAMKAPEAFAIVVGAALIGAAIYLRGPTNVYNVQMVHPETDAILRSVHEVMRKQRKTNA